MYCYDCCEIEHQFFSDDQFLLLCKCMNKNCYLNNKPSFCIISEDQASVVNEQRENKRTNP